MAGLIKRGKTYYVVLTTGGRQTRRSLRTGTYQVALARKREIEAQATTGGVSVLPTRTPIGEIVGAYIDHMKTHRPERSWRKDMTHLREAFGPC
ncbi:MAG: hypothetical protein RIB32_00120 [Phycisphaerales bacterium]